MLEVIEKLKCAFDAATERLNVVITSISMWAGRRPTLLAYRVICSEEDAMHWPEEDFGNLRMASNAAVWLARLWGDLRLSSVRAEGVGE